MGTRTAWGLLSWMRAWQKAKEGGGVKIAKWVSAGAVGLASAFLAWNSLSVHNSVSDVEGQLDDQNETSVPRSRVPA